jgi:Domain of unknown function (DUF4389)
MTGQTYWPPQPAAPTRGPRGGGIALVALGSVIALIAFGLLTAGGVLMWADQTQRNAAGYLTSPTTRLAASSYAIAATDLNVAVSAPEWHVSSDALGSVRITATAAASNELFLGIASSSDVLRYLNGAAYDQLSGYAAASTGPTYHPHSGGAPALPTSQTFWRTEVSGGGTQSLTWKVESGHWGIIVMNADASRGVAAEVSVGATAPFLFALALGLLIGGAVALLIAGLLLFGGMALLRPGASVRSAVWTPPPPVGVLPPPPPVNAPTAYPLRIEGRLDASRRWLGMVKWFLLIPHYIALAFLFAAGFVLTVIAFFAILFTGRYPRSIFDFNVAVLRWWWRVGFYGYSALGTDRYPPFTFDVAADYPATLEVPYPEGLSRGLVLVKWLLAIPHYLIVAVLVGGTTLAVHGAYTYQVPYSGLITLLVLIAALALLFTARYPHGIFDLVMGLNRWVYRTLVYVLLLRDEYPPFRLDLGGDEHAIVSGVPAPPPLSALPTTAVPGGVTPGARRAARSSRQST